jgi:hypothetical protein
LVADEEVTFSGQPLIITFSADSRTETAFLARDDRQGEHASPAPECGESAAASPNHGLHCKRRQARPQGAGERPPHQRPLPPYSLNGKRGFVRSRGRNT